jgi:small neutral amino acid transporter SnatA (MarC family)
MNNIIKILTMKPNSQSLTIIKKSIIIILLLFVSLFAEEYKLMFWNVENLF